MGQLPQPTGPAAVGQMVGLELVGPNLRMLLPGMIRGRKVL